MTYDFSCWLLKYNGASVYGRVYQKGSIQVVENQIVPLCWNHRHYDPKNVLGHAMLENREEGIYVYGTFTDNSNKESIIQLIRDRGSVSVSPYVWKIKYDGKIIISGVIREVSLVPVRIDPDESYYPVLNKESEVSNHATG